MWLFEESKMERKECPKLQARKEEQIATLRAVPLAN